MENLNEKDTLGNLFSAKGNYFNFPTEKTLSYIKPKLSLENYSPESLNLTKLFNIESSDQPSNISSDEFQTSSQMSNGIVEIFGDSSINRWIPKLDISKENLIFDKPITQTTQPVQGTKTFNDAFDAVQSRIPEIKKYRDFLTKLAQRESSFNPKARASNSTGSALGYFQFMPFNRKGLSDKVFANNPELQIEMAFKLLKNFKNSFDNTDFSKARAKGYTESAILAGAWLGGPGGVKRFLNTGYNAHDNLGTGIKSYMDKFNKLV